ncbi:MAG: tRNA guanosine(34) transglycosylase Tgt [bacterium]|nr:tRNA guanosine(34) transglycosylase Tgt [bacterium]
MEFTIIKESDTSRARKGLLKLGQTVLETPVFMPVGTKGTVKTLDSGELKEIGLDLILANTYHLYLRPGLDVIKNAGGLHSFMNWDRALLTDSGGYQVFSLPDLKKVTDEGVLFKSHIDGQEIFFTPESVMEAQIIFGSDIVMCLDECVEHTAPLKKTREAVIRTTLWSRRCKEYFNCHKKPHQNLFGIVQGGFDKGLRKESLEQICELGFDGYAVGGLSVGETYEKTFDILDSVTPGLPREKPRYFMGLGSLDELEQAVRMGVDMFDSVWPTRNARNGQVFTSEGKKQVRNARFKYSLEPVDKECSCFVCRNHTLSYLHHLFNVEELLGYKLATYHNLYFLQNRIKQIRDSI